MATATLFSLEVRIILHKLMETTHGPVGHWARKNRAVCPGNPDGNKPPPVEGGFETSFVSRVFGDNMVLQRGKPNTVWGWAQPGEEIRVTIAANTVKTMTREDGRWSVAIQPPAPGGPYTVVIDGSQHVEFHEVLVGDVWLCGGQSNMEMGLGAARNGSEEVKTADHPRIRLFVVKQQTARSPAAVLPFHGHGRQVHLIRLLPI